MKLLAVYSTDRILGGGEISFTLTVASVLASGWEVLAVVPGPGPLQTYLERHNIPVEILPQESLRGAAIARLIRPPAEWVSLIQRFQPDLIHCNAVRSALYGQAAGRRCQVPVILHARKEMSDPVDRFLLWRLTAIICISQVVRNRFAGKSGRAYLEVIYNAVDIDALQKPGNAPALRRQWLRSESDILVGLPGRFSPIKGQHRLVNAARQIVSRVPGVRFIFIGEEDESFKGYAAELIQSIREKELEDSFVFAGFHEDMTSVYHALDLIVFPTSSEAFGRILIETGGTRKPLVGNDIEVLRELLGDHSPDYLVNCDDAGAFARRIIQLLEDEPLRTRSANRLYEYVRKTFGIEAHRTRILKMYDKVIFAFRSQST